MSPPHFSTRSFLRDRRAARRLRDEASRSPQGLPNNSKFSVLRLYNYRIFITSQVVANAGVWMQRIAQDWLVLTLTGSVTAVGITTALQFIPVVLFGPLGGLLVDRYSKRALMMITQSTAAVLATLLAVLTFSGNIQVAHVYAIALALGFVTAVDNPARLVFVPELVGREHLRAAVGFNSSVFQLGALVGPALGGFLIAAFGEGWAFTVNAIGCSFVVLMLTRIRSDLLHRVPRLARAPRQVRASVQHVLDTPPIFWTMVLIGVAGLLALNMPVLLTAFADRVFHSGAGGFGTFNAMIAVGGIIGAIGATQKRVVRLRNLITYAILLGCALAAASLAPNAWIFQIALIGIGAATLTLVISAHLFVQLGIDAAIQGRIMALYVMVQLGGRTIGGPAIGWASEEFGPRFTLLICGGLMVIAAGVVGRALARNSALKFSLHLRNRGTNPVLAIVPRTAEGATTGS